MYSIDLLSKLTGFSKRTIRYYIEIGLLEPPVGACRGSYYTEQHLSKLQAIKLWTNNGVPVTQIKLLMEDNKNNHPIKHETNMTCKFERYKLDDNIEINFRNNVLDEKDLLEISNFIKKLIESKLSNSRINF
ncbi:MAG: hypothetical protein KatS3mg068_0156 [Candidatus Sericytochromatia bacterium]|nr:MAG: hypothetical protein KatS3mg068_0156 [Candidatus Sericytochromatia bacterium]